MNQPRPVAGIPEDRVAAILARAAELDRPGPAVLGLEAIRTAALEAGISESAVDQAIAEYQAGIDAPIPVVQVEEPKAPFWRRVLRFVIRGAKPAAQLAGIGTALGLIVGVGEAGVAIGWLGWVALAARLVWLDRPSRKAHRFVLAMALLAFFVCFGCALVESDDEVFALLVFSGVWIAGIGAAAIKLRLPKWLRRQAQVTA